MKTLQLSLTTKWFSLTATGGKKEDYREITPYWAARLVDFSDRPKENKDDSKNYPADFAFDLQKGHSLLDCLNSYQAKLKPFDKNKMTLGYPSRNDLDRVLEFKHLGIEVRTGNNEWGAEPGKLYFVIKHGERIS